MAKLVPYELIFSFHALILNVHYRILYVQLYIFTYSRMEYDRW